MKIERILRTKGPHAPTVSPQARVADVIEALDAEDVGALVVSEDGQRIDGIISERDVVRGLKRFGGDILNHTVSDLMTDTVTTCTTDDRVAGIMAVMDNQQIRHVPVVDHGVLAGMVSIRDIVKLRLDEVQAEADAMRSYIGGAA